MLNSTKKWFSNRFCLNWFCFSSIQLELLRSVRKTGVVIWRLLIGNWNFNQKMFLSRIMFIEYLFFVLICLYFSHLTFNFKLFQTITKIWVKRTQSGTVKLNLNLSISIIRHNDLPWNIRKFLKNQLREFRFGEDLRGIAPWSTSAWSHTDLHRLKEGMVSAQVSSWEFVNWRP